MPAVPEITARQLNRATLARQLLLRREPIDVVGAVHRIVALQAQEPATPYLALWNRIAGFDPADLDTAFARGSIVKATIMRITLHAVDAADYPAFHEAMQTTLRAARLNDRRFRRTGLSIADADGLIPEVLVFAAVPRTNAAAEAWLDERLGETPKPGVWWALRQYGPFLHAPTGGPWSFGPRPSYVGAPEVLRRGRPSRDDALARLVRRYLEGFGPATAQDIAQFALINAPFVRDGLRALEGELVRLEGPGGTELFDVADGVLPSGDEPAPPRLLPMWDSTVLAYKDRTRVIAPELRKLVMRTNGDVLPTVLVDGYVAGVWRPVDDGIEVSALVDLDDEAWEGVEAEARALIGSLASREAVPYRRYAHWWTTLPSASVRIVRQGEPACAHRPARA